jgi:hypothetical protein
MIEAMTTTTTIDDPTGRNDGDAVAGARSDTEKGIGGGEEDVTRGMEVGGEVGVEVGMG